MKERQVVRYRQKGKDKDGDSECAGIRRFLDRIPNTVKIILFLYSQQTNRGTEEEFKKMTVGDTTLKPMAATKDIKSGSEEGITKPGSGEGTKLKRNLGLFDGVRKINVTSH